MDHKLYFYRTNQGSTTKSRFSLKKLDYLWALESIIGHYTALGYLQMRQAEKRVEAESRIENLNEFISITTAFDSREDSENRSLSAFLAEVALFPRKAQFTHELQRIIAGKALEGRTQYAGILADIAVLGKDTVGDIALAAASDGELDAGLFMAVDKRNAQPASCRIAGAQQASRAGTDDCGIVQH